MNKEIANHLLTIGAVTLSPTKHLHGVQEFSHRSIVTIA